MSFMHSLRAGSAAAALLAAASVPAIAQEITSEIRGTVVDASGAPIAGATVVVTDTRTGRSNTTTTNNNGVFAVRNLQVSGDYTVTVTAPGYIGQSVENVSADLSAPTSVTIQLEAGEETEIITVTASADTVTQIAIGPAATFSQRDLQRLPATNRSLNDIIRTDPRIYIDEAFVDAVQCAGANPRFNSLTVDGVRLNDNFGLNSNGFPTERQPFPFDAIDQVAVELSPISVEYGGFSACTINAVTKSGGNEFFGGGFFDYTGSSLRGGSLEGEPINNPEFSEKRYGMYLGGPIIEDKLFFFAAYERLEGANVFTRGFEGSGAINEVAGFSQQDFDDILRIARDIYQYDPGETPGSFPNEDDKLLVRIDWNITDAHRASFTYNYNDGFNITQSDGDRDEFEYSNHLYERGAELQSYVGSLYSDWTDNFSTEIRIGYVDLENRQISIGGTDFGEMQIGVRDEMGNSATVYIGGDDSRQSNRLSYDIFTTVFKGFYSVGDHLITAGYEREEFNVFNLFVQHTEGEYRFGSIADFEAGEPFRIEYANAPSGNPEDAAADWGYTINTAYLQDEWTIPEWDLTLVGGFRYEWYQSDDVPPQNDAFTEFYGFSNSQNLDGKSLFQPRFGFNWNATSNMEVRGGIGRYGGGNPNVWLSNNYSANSVTQFTVRDSDVGIADVNLFDLTYVANEPGTPAGPGYGIPQEMFDAVATGGRNFEINALDPDFEIPSEWKFTLGATYLWYAPEFVPGLGGEFVFNVDMLYSFSNNAAIVRRLDLEREGTLVAGIPDYASPGPDAFVLTNSDEGTEAFNFAVSVQKSYEELGIDWTLGYAYSNAEDANPMTSSVAFSNYNNVTFVDPNNLPLARSNYDITHRITMRVDYTAELFDPEFETRFTLFGTVNSGERFSYAFENANNLYNFTPFLEGPMLLYVPTGPNDPNVQFADGFDVDRFFRFINEAGLDEYAGGFAERNAFEARWFTKFDLKIEQEIPGFFDGHKAAGFFIIENLGNLINDEWGILYQPSFPNGVRVVDADLSDDGTQFVYNSFSPAAFRNPTSRVGGVSQWSIRLGVKYEF